jgi:hypothetical protein
MENWQADRNFKAEPGQEITQEVYDAMLNGVPPKTLPPETAIKALEEYNVPVHAGFLMGEPDSDDSEGRALYLAFGMNDYGKGKHYFYLGLSPAIRKKRDGIYYYMDCLNAFVNDGLFPASEFKDDAEAIQTAANYEAYLYKYEYKNGQRISSTVLYEPSFL